MKIDLHFAGGTIVPMDRDHHWFEGDLLIRDGAIVNVNKGPAKDVDAALTIDVSGCVVIPGFVQCHVHVVQALLRHQADQLSLLDWLKRKTLPYEAALDADGVEAATSLGIAELLCGGTTTALDMGTTHDHDRVFRVAEEMGIRFVSGKTHMDLGADLPSGLLEDTDTSLSDAKNLGSRWHLAADGRLRYAVAPRFALSCSERLLKECASLARSNDWMLHSHTSENIDEVAAIRQLTGRSNIEFFESTGFTGEDVVLAHGVHLAPQEIAILARTGTRICHCPGANLKLASGIADIPTLMKSGVHLGIGADGPPCNNRLSVFHEMALAGTIHGLRHGPAAIDPWTVLALATRLGAEALHLDHLVGTLEVSKRADVTVIALDDWPLLPSGNPASRLVFGASAGHVRHVVVDGKLLVKDHQLNPPEKADSIKQNCRQVWRATASRMETSP